MVTRASAAPRRASESLFFPAFEACPGCEGRIRCRSVVDLTVFVCATCGSWWHVELGVAYRLVAGSEPEPTTS